MDNPNLRIDDLFDRLKKRLDRCKERERLQKEQRKRKYQVDDHDPCEVRSDGSYCPSLLSSEECQASVMSAPPVLSRSSPAEMNINTNEEGSSRGKMQRVSSLGKSDTESQQLSQLISDIKEGSEYNMDDPPKPKPECIPLSEQLRRQRVEDEIRAMHAKLTQKPTFKPLKWNKPSFTFTSSVEESSIANGTSSPSDESGK